jgi:protein-S-isoprenylcysteine O-methyltransferase Ste14
MLAQWVWMSWLVAAFVVMPLVFRSRHGRWPFAYAWTRPDIYTLTDWLYAAALAGYTALLFRAPSPEAYAGVIGEYAGLAVFTLGFGLQVWAVSTMGRHWRLGQDPEEASPEYVAHGPFALLRHPIYVSLLIIAVSMGLLGGFDARWLLLVGATCLYFGVQGRAETLHWTRRARRGGSA